MTLAPAEGVTESTASSITGTVIVATFPVGTVFAGTAAGAVSISLRGTGVGVVAGTPATVGFTPLGPWVGGGWGVILVGVWSVSLLSWTNKTI